MVLNKSLSSVTLSTSGVSVKYSWLTSEKIEPAKRFLLFIFTNKRLLPHSVINSGVMPRETSSTGAIAVITPDKGLVTTFSLPSSDHLVFIDSESLPTGTDISKSTQIFESASTPFLKSKFSLSSFVGAIQLAETCI